ncbi:PREDICTED: putative tRNA pseudouridine synthase Pus10 [Trachymyrmex cornetzi]|uniref:putative tRNA pseudouridine synthase Pus10 n=1 Tax=Trachymyrmex cornetzi TaxID=471704 RepID=UPI00084EF34F|nr:PREDICTED: putative tRNA pseudouridine synthase Pus10 [Trachymyrmex cornetzi]XP_018366463.1 PREDICTED: putative tRNA pseudouridine synthase Pus10 [Trachymyrmex cornetzi]
MNTVTTEEERKILHFLKSQGCCLRCCFRFVGYRTSECYCKPSEFAAQLSYANIKDDASMEETTCIACLGVLQDKAQKNVVTKIAEKVKEKDYDCITFTCALTVPVSVKLREHILYAYMSKEMDIHESILSTLKTKLQNVKDIWKSFIIPQLEQATGKHADLSTPSPFLIEVLLMYADDEMIFKELINEHKGGNNKRQKKRKCNDNKFSRKNVDTLLIEMTDEQLMRHFTISQIVPKTFVHVDDVLCSHSSIFIGGRYNKLSRKLSQTPWLINGEKKVETSVQDLLCNPIAEMVKAESIKFLSSGREDVDVRNIYGGRPFAIELLNPRMTNITNELLMCLTSSINQSTKQVQITSNLKILSRFDLKKLKEGENVKTKFYRALCVCRDVSGDLPPLEHLNELENVKIIQRTPLRVLHRRPLSPRTRIIYKMRARWAKPHELKELLSTTVESTDAFFVLDVKTQAGTYVKEFVHGDFGRTKPSLCDFLNTEVDIVALDVTGINLKWP